MTRATKGFLLVFISAAGFGAMPVFARSAYQSGANLFELLTARFLVAGLVLSVYLRWKKPPRPLTVRERGGAVLMGLCGYAVASLCFFSALERVPAPLASLLLYTYPALVTVLAIMFGMEKPDRRKLSALLVSFAGITLILGSSFATVNLSGAALALAASLMYSGYILVGNWTLREAPLAAATAWISWAAAAGIGGFGLAGGYLSFSFGPAAWLSVAGLALFSTIVAILAFLQGVVLVGASRASIISTLEPPVTVVLAALFLAETLGPLQLLGGALVLGSAVLANWEKGGKEQAVEARGNIRN